MLRTTYSSVCRYTYGGGGGGGGGGVGGGVGTSLKLQGAVSLTVGSVPRRIIPKVRQFN